jgi:hypothetical protein
MGPPSYMRSVVNRNVVMRRIPVITTTFCMKRTDVRVEGKTLIFKLDEDGNGADPWDFFPEPHYELTYN